jgi:hypothetical protein
MTMPAVVVALEAMSQPDMVRRQLRRPLPDDLIDLIKCAAGDRETILRITKERNITEDSLVEASKFFLRHVVGSGGSDKRRTLGLPKSASKADVREHRRWLLKWLHPDRNPSKWEAKLFLKVEIAANTLVAEDSKNAKIIALAASRRGRQRVKPKKIYVSAAFALPTDDEQYTRRMRRFLTLSCLGISFLSLLLFGLSEWLPAR